MEDDDEPIAALQGVSKGHNEGVKDLNKLWILDSGAAMHVVSRENVMDIDVPGRLLDMKHPTSVSTANGSLAIDKYVRSYVPSFGSDS